MEELTGLGKSVLTVDPIKIKLDRTVKSILAYKPILSRILKTVVLECRDMTYDEVEACIEGEVIIGQEPVDPGLSNAIVERIDGLSTESFFNEEGLNLFDIRTYLQIPSEGGKIYIKLLINVEAQNDDKPGYDISLRALFHCCRMISAQQGIEFSTASDDPIKYGNIKKVYSIWICTETAQKRANSIESYTIDRRFLVGSNQDNPRYDILNAVIINISAKHETDGTDNELIRFLTDLFNEEIGGADKVKKLKEEYDLRVTREIDTEVTEMCTYATAMERKGIEQGIEQEKENGLKALVQSLKRYVKDFESLYQDVISNEDYSGFSREQVMKYYG